MAKTVLVPIGHGVEEGEFVCLVDILRRAQAQVTIASVEEGLSVKSARGIQFVAEKLVSECTAEAYDLIALPGGMPGSERLRDTPALIQLLKAQQERQGWIGAICAAPVVVLHTHGLIGPRLATAFPSLSGQLPNQGSVTERVVVDGRLVTSRGLGTAIEFALRLVKELYDEARAQEIAQAILASAH